MPKDRSEILQGTLDLMVLKTLDALGPLHGYGIARRIEQLSEELLRLNEGTVYASLLRLGKQPTSQVLFDHFVGAQTIGSGSRELGAHFRRNWTIFAVKEPALTVCSERFFRESGARSAGTAWKKSSMRKSRHIWKC
jgi:Transcriptional regulator PadR-like family